MALNWEKFKALVHYICDKAESPSELGSIKLNKVLWYSDVINYMVTGESMTGETYVKRQFGPVPRDVLGAVEQLVSEGKIARGRVDHFGHMKNEYIAILPSDKSIFSGNEISLIDEAYEHVCLNHTAKSISEETHGTIWRIAEMGEVLPYETVFASHVGEINDDDFLWARNELAQQQRLAA